MPLTGRPTLSTMLSSSRRNGPPDDGLDIVAEGGGALHAGAGGRPDVEPHLAGVHAGEKSSPRKGASRQEAAQKPRKQTAKSGAGAGRPPASRGSPRGTARRPLQTGRGSGRTSPGLPCGFVHVVPQEEHHQRRHDRPGEQVGGEHGEHHRLGQRHKEVARGPREKEHRHEHDADAEGRDERRHGDLGRTVQDGGAQLLALPEVALDVLDLDRRVVHEDADRQGQPPRVMMFIVSPSALRVMMEQRIARGMEITMTNVVRQFPRKTRIMIAVRQAAMTASLTTDWTAARTKML